MHVNPHQLCCWGVQSGCLGKAEYYDLSLQNRKTNFLPQIKFWQVTSISSSPCCSFQDFATSCNAASGGIETLNPKGGGQSQLKSHVNILDLSASQNMPQKIQIAKHRSHDFLSIQGVTLAVFFHKSNLKKHNCN